MRIKLKPLFVVVAVVAALLLIFAATRSSSPAVRPDAICPCRVQFRLHRQLTPLQASYDERHDEEALRVDQKRFKSNKKVEEEDAEEPILVGDDLQGMQEEALEVDIEGDVELVVDPKEIGEIEEPDMRDQDRKPDKAVKKQLGQKIKEDDVEVVEAEEPEPEREVEEEQEAMEEEVEEAAEEGAEEKSPVIIKPAPTTTTTTTRRTVRTKKTTTTTTTTTTRPTTKPTAAKKVTAARAKMVSGDSKADCLLATKEVQEADVQVKQLVKENPFSNPPNAGGWKQGWDVTYNEHEWDQEPLKIWLMPHSHNDPGMCRVFICVSTDLSAGWLKTLDEYFRLQTKGIITAMTESLANVQAIPRLSLP
jgi:hypothetical protein